MGILASINEAADWFSTSVALPVHHVIADTTTEAINLLAVGPGGTLGGTVLGLIGGLGFGYVASSAFHATHTNKAVNIITKIGAVAAALIGAGLTIGAVGTLTGGVGLVAYAAGAGIVAGSYFLDPGRFNFLKAKPVTWLATYA